MKRSSQDTATAAGVRAPHPDTTATSRPQAPAERPPDLRGPSKLVLRGAAVVAVTLLASLATLQPAGADTRRFTDRAGDTGLPADITTVRVSNGAERIKVAVRPGRVEFGDHFTFWLDTRPRNAGPEYKVGVLPNSDAFGLLRVGAFGRQGRPLRCDGLRATADHFAPEWVSISVPRSCLQNPGKVRVAVRARYTDADTTVVDWAPAKRTFSGWVAR